MKKRFEFEFKMSIRDLAGNKFTALIFVYGADEFEAWDPDRGVPVSLFKISEKEQTEILNVVAQRFAQRAPSSDSIFDPNSGPSYVNWINGGSR